MTNLCRKEPGSLIDSDGCFPVKVCVRQYPYEDPTGAAAANNYDYKKIEVHENTGSEALYASVLGRCENHDFNDGVYEATQATSNNLRTVCVKLDEKQNRAGRWDSRRTDAIMKALVKTARKGHIPALELHVKKGLRPPSIYQANVEAILNTAKSEELT